MMKRAKYVLFFLSFCFIGCNNSNINNEPLTKTEMEAKKERSIEFKNINPKEIPGNIIEMIAEQWMLITAGNKESYNTMTASWGGLGNLWGKPIFTCYIDPDRYTFRFMEEGECYTLCFFDEAYRQALQICGTTSGRDYKDKNKAEEAGLTPAFTENGTPYFKEAYLVIECKKLYSDQFKKDCFATDVVTQNMGKTSVYNERESYHKFYIGEIINCMLR